MDPYASLPGWHLIGQFPDHEPGDVGSWLLHHNGEAMLLEVPPGLTVDDVRKAMKAIGSPRLKFGFASHHHFDHLDPMAWSDLIYAFPSTVFICPGELSSGDHCLPIGGEPCWLIKAPKHSISDTVTVFRGVGMTGDIELHQLKSINREVRKATRQASMDWLKGFQRRHGYHVHSVTNAHQREHSIRRGVDWESLFSCRA
nr:hypothetical protein [uncultured Rhodopila sp.]